MKTFVMLQDTFDKLSAPRFDKLSDRSSGFRSLNGVEASCHFGTAEQYLKNIEERTA